MPDGIERSLSLDVSNALDSIGSINDAFLATVATFEAGLDSALAVLGSVTVGDVDTTAVDAALVASIETASATPAVIEGDATAVTDAIDTSITSADNSLEVLADTGAIPPDIEAAIASADNTVSVDADVGPAVDQIAAIQPEPVIVDIEADTGAAVDQIDSLNESAVDTSASFGDLSGGVAIFSAAAGAASGDANDLSGAVGGISEGAGAAAAGLATLAGFTGAVVKNALDADTSQRRFNETLGATADQVEHINVGGLDTDISHLAITVGSSDEALRNAASRIAELGTSSGASQAQVGQVAEQILALSARLAVVNPNLGDAGAIADRLTNAFVRGGRALTPFGISLSAAEISSRALANTNKTSADQLSVFDKISAGAAISAGRLGDKLGGDVKRGAEGAAIQFRSTRVQLDEFLEALGRPLITPVLDLLQEAIPSAEALGRILADLAQAVLPALEGPLQVTGDILGVVAGVIEAIPAPALSAALAFAGFGLATAHLAAALGSLEVLGIVGTAIAGFAAPIAIAVGALAAGAAAFHVFGNSSDDAAKKAQESAEKILGSGNDLDSTASAIDKLSASIDTLVSSADGFGGASDKIREQLVRLGLTNRDLEAALTGTNAEFERFTAQVEAAAGKASVFNTKGLEAAEALDTQRAALESTARARLGDLQASEEVSGAIAHEAVVRNTARDGTVNYIGALEDATSAAEEHKAAVEAQAQALAVQTVDWGNLSVSILQGKVGLEDVAAISKQFGLDENTVSQFVNDITRSLDAFVSTATAALPTVKNAFTTFQTGISDAAKALHDASTETDPDAQKIADSFSALADASDPQRLIENVQKQAKAIAEFQGNVEAQLRAGNERVAKLLIEQGPVVGGALAQSLHDGQPKTARELEGNLNVFQTAYDGYESFIRTQGGPQVLTATGEWADGVTGVVKDNLDLTSPLADQVDKATKELGSTDIERAARANADRASQNFRDFITFQTDAGHATREAGKAITDNAPPLATSATNAGVGGRKGFRTGFTPDTSAEEAMKKVSGAIDTATETIKTSAHTSGQGIGESFISGIELGMQLSQARLIDEGLRIVGNTVGAVRQGSKSFSPSLVFRDIGKDWIDGWVMGLQDDRVERRVAELTLAAVGAADARFPSPSVPQVSPAVLTGAGVGSVTIGSLVENLNLTMQNGTEAEVRRVGGKIVDTISEELFRRGIAAEVRA